MVQTTEDIAWFGPRVGERERIRVSDVLTSGYINDGDVTRLLEAEIASLVGVFAPGVVLPGYNFYFLTLVLIPFALATAVLKSEKAPAPAPIM